MNTPDSLAEIRSGIDAIDNEMLSLIARRLVLAKSLRALKPAERAAWAPAREHALLQRLLDHKPPNLPAETLVSMWSALITASLMSQGPFVIFSADAQMAALAEAAFPGAPMAILHMKHWQEQIAATPGAIAVLPFPTQNQSWWQEMARADAPPLFVQTCLPKWPPGKAQACCVSPDRPSWQKGQLCWSVAKTDVENTTQIARSDTLYLLESLRPIASDTDLPDPAAGPIALGNFPPPLTTGLTDD